MIIQQKENVMRFNLVLSNESGTISLSLNREFSDLEIQNITTYLASVIKGTLPDNQDVISTQSNNQSTISTLPADSKQYYLSSFGYIPSKITAIKLLRTHLKVVLKEAKDIVDGSINMSPVSSKVIKAIVFDLKLNGIHNFKVLQDLESSNL